MSFRDLELWCIQHSSRVVGEYSEGCAKGIIERKSMESRCKMSGHTLSLDVPFLGLANGVREQSFELQYERLRMASTEPCD